MGALTLIGAAVSAVGAVAAGRAEANAAGFNATMAQQQAEREREIAVRDADDYRRRNSRLLAASRARRAGSGLTAQGSPLLVDETTAAEIELGVQDIFAGAAAGAYGHQQQAALSRARARSARSGSVLSAGSTLLTGASATDYDSFFRLP